MNQVNTSLKIGDLVEVLYRHRDEGYGVVLGFKEYTEPGKQDVCAVMVKVLFLDKVVLYPLIWCKLVQKINS